MTRQQALYKHSAPLELVLVLNRTLQRFGSTRLGTCLLFGSNFNKIRTGLRFKSTRFQDRMAAAEAPKEYTGYWIEEGYILGPRESGRFWIQDGWICGPRNSGKFWIQDGCIFGPNQSGEFRIDEGRIYGPHPTPPWLD